LRRPSASSTRSWLSYIRSWGWTLSLATDNPHRTSSCRSSPVKAIASGASAARLPSSRGPAHQRYRLWGERATRTDVPTRALTSMPTPTLMPCRSSGGHRRSSPLQPCCCAAIRRQQPLRRDGCTSCRCLNLSNSIGGTRNKVEDGDHHDL
jgi:hypothetical protein